jgi:hypothetical protein
MQVGIGLGIEEVAAAGEGGRQNENDRSEKPDDLFSLSFDAFLHQNIPPSFILAVFPFFRRSP